MGKFCRLLKKAFTPVTIMVVPHENVRSLNLKVPFVGILVSILLFVLGNYYMFSIAVNGLEYRTMKEKVNYYSKEFGEWSTTALALKKMEEDFQKLFSLGSKEKVLENVDSSVSGDIDLPTLKQELETGKEKMDGIKKYLRVQKDFFRVTPRGFPAWGRLTSHYGKREDPFDAEIHFHPGVDIAAGPGTPIRATADGMVSHSGWAGNSGNVVVLEHGRGFSTIYAHNARNVVKAGQRVKRGDILGYVGSTGRSTGSHVHYEVWQNGRRVDPQKFLRGRS